MEKSGSFPMNRGLPAPFAFGRNGLTYDGQMISNYCPAVVTVKIYVNGELSGSGYHTKRICPAVNAETVQTHPAVQGYTYYDTALPYDALQ